jgi:hypothetical protein
MQSTGELPVQVPSAPRVRVRGLEYLATTAAFIVSRVVLQSLGVSFNAEALDWYWQVLDPALLRNGLAESLFFLHVQPPLFNLVIGGAAGLFQDPAPLLAWGWAAVGLALMLTFQATLRRLGWPVVPAALAAVACSLSLPWIVYEHWLFYDFPCAALLAFGGYCLLRDRARVDPRWAAGFTATLVVLALSRSLFHLVWVIAAAAIFFFTATRDARRRAALWMLVPVLLVVALFAKNAAVFGFFGSSSWLGPSLNKMTVQRLGPDERAEMMREGHISAFAAVVPFSPLEDYEVAAGSRFTDGEVPALGARLRSSGHPNFNHRAFVDVSETQLRDSVAAMKARPDLYRGAVVTAPALQGGVDRPGARVSRLRRHLRNQAGRGGRLRARAAPRRHRHHVARSIRSRGDPGRIRLGRAESALGAGGGVPAGSR